MVFIIHLSAESSPFVGAWRSRFGRELKSRLLPQHFALQQSWVAIGVSNRFKEFTGDDEFSAIEFILRRRDKPEPAPESKLNTKSYTSPNIALSVPAFRWSCSTFFLKITHCCWVDNGQWTAVYYHAPGWVSTMLNPCSQIGCKRKRCLRVGTGTSLESQRTGLVRQWVRLNNSTLRDFNTSPAHIRGPHLSFHYDDSPSWRELLTGFSKGGTPPKQPDQTPTSTVQHCADQLSQVFTDIFNTSLETCHVPVPFSTSTIVPLTKKPKTTGLNDYKPVTLTSVVMKSFECIVGLPVVRCQQVSRQCSKHGPLFYPPAPGLLRNLCQDPVCRLQLHF